ncbi:MAG TPA: hypothetical protein VI542_32715 [Candidatus Tectomicrobia bacterium]
MGGKTVRAIAHGKRMRPIWDMRQTFRTTPKGPTVTYDTLRRDDDAVQTWSV